MNQGLFGFPPADLSDLHATRKSWSYIRSGGAVAGMPARATNTVYYNHTGEEIEVFNTFLGSGGVGAASIHISTTPNQFATARDQTSTYASAGSGIYTAIYGVVPPGYYYKIVPEGAYAMHIWTEVRKNP